MSFLSLLPIERLKIKRSRILWIFAAAAAILWIPSILHAKLNFSMQAEGISPEHSFFIQGFLGMAWFMYPASMVVCCTLLTQTERSHKGLLKMLSLPVGAARLCLAKFTILLLLSAVQMLLMAAMYYISAALAQALHGYPFVLPPSFVAKEVLLLLFSSLPMLAWFWMLSVCIQTPIFSVGAGLASIVPSVLLINTKLWFASPTSYPLFAITAEYGKLAANLDTPQAGLLPWLPVAAAVTILCLSISCLRFGRAETQ